MDQLITATFTLILVMDPLGNVPLFVSLVKSIPEERRNKVLIREFLIALLIMGVFLLAGDAFLGVFGLSSESLSIAGGIVLFIIALRMIFPVRGGIMGKLPDGEPFIVPMAIPCIAGPSTLATLLLFGSEPGQLPTLSLAAMVAWTFTSVILFFCTQLHRVLGERALIAMERLMGMLLVALSVQMLLDGTLDYVRKIL